MIKRLKQWMKRRHAVASTDLLADPCDQTVQMADHILNHYSRHSRLDKICLARRLEKWAKEFTANNKVSGPEPAAKGSHE
jgi:hypothetical protein